jgi:hypothetical protein
VAGWSRKRERGQAALLLLGALGFVLVGALILGAIAAGVGVQGRDQRAADLAALAGARALRGAYPRVFEPSVLAGRPNSRHLERAAYLALGRTAALATARRNGAARIAVGFPSGGLAPVRIRVTVSDPLRVAGAALPHRATAEAELAPPGGIGGLGAPGAGEYRGPFAMRQGKPMRPDVALAFDRMARAASADGVGLVVVSAFRGDAEQAVLFARHPDPKWVAPPGHSLHRLGTELDLGPASAYGWLAAHAPAFHFRRRYAWEPWHFGYVLSPGTTSVGFGARSEDGGGGGALPSFVPERFAPALSRAAQRWSVSAALLAAQLYRESGFNPFARSSAGAQGIAQFMPGTAALYGLGDPFDAPAAIDAQAHLMSDLLHQFGDSVSLALAAYNAGPGAVEACGCVPDIPETEAYVARILGLMGGAGELVTPTLEVRLVA